MAMLEQDMSSAGCSAVMFIPGQGTNMYSNSSVPVVSTVVDQPSEYDAISDLVVNDRVHKSASINNDGQVGLPAQVAYLKPR